jgi:hypothetical protein
VYTWYKITAVEEVMRGMDDVVCQGKVLYIGMPDRTGLVGGPGQRAGSASSMVVVHLLVRDRVRTVV